MFQIVQTLASNHFKYCTHPHLYGCNDLLMIYEACKSREIRTCAISFLQQLNAINFTSIQYSTFATAILTGSNARYLRFPYVVYVSPRRINSVRRQFPGLRYYSDFPYWSVYSPVVVTSDRQILRQADYSIDTTGTLNCDFSAPMSVQELTGLLTFVRISAYSTAVQALSFAQRVANEERYTFRSSSLHPRDAQCAILAPMLLLLTSTSCLSVTTPGQEIFRTQHHFQGRRRRANNDKYKRF